MISKVACGVCAVYSPESSIGLRVLQIFYQSDSDSFVLAYINICPYCGEGTPFYSEMPACAC